MTDILQSEYTDAKEVAAILKVPVSTVHYWAATKKGPPSFKVEKHRRWAKEDVIGRFVLGATLRSSRLR